MSPSCAGKMGHACFTQCIPSAMVNDKLLPVPLVFPLSAYQFYLFLLMNLHILNRVGEYTYTSGEPMVGKPCIMVSQWRHTKDATSGGKGLFSVDCGYVHRDKGHMQDCLCDSRDLPTGDSHAGQFVLGNTLGGARFPQNTAEVIQGPSCSNFTISINIKAESKLVSIETSPSPCGCPQLYAEGMIALVLG